MDVQSLGYRTDLMIVGWGVLFAAPPDRGAAIRWPATFRAAFAEQPEVRHICLAWDAVEDTVGEVEPFLEAGYTLNRSIVLTAAPRDVHMPVRHAAPAATIRPLITDADWNAATALQVATTNERLGRDSTVWQTHQIVSRARFASGFGYSRPSSERAPSSDWGSEAAGGKARDIAIPIDTSIRNAPAAGGA